MLAKKHRATSFYLKNSKSIRTPLFSIRFSELQNKDSAKFGFVVSKKIDKRAVVRNLVKRKIRKCIEELISEINPGKIIIFYPTKASIEATQEDLRIEIYKVFRNCGFLKSA